LEYAFHCHDDFGATSGYRCNCANPSEKTVSILNEVRVAPTSSEERMAAGEKTALKENWKLNGAEDAFPLFYVDCGVRPYLAISTFERP